MDSAVLAHPRVRALGLRVPGPATLVAAAAFALLFWRPATTLVSDWWSDPNAGHGLLLAPVAFWLAYRRGLVPALPRPATGLALLAAAILLRCVSGLAAELFTMRLSLLMAAVALLVYTRGWRQIRHWWLPLGLLLLCIPLPAVIMSSLALPLQFRASAIGAWLLRARDVPVVLSGNVIHLPGRSLFVTEACSGLRSLSALLAIGLLVAGLWLSTTAGRALLLLLTIPVAVLLNAVRVFLTGFLVVFVDPRLGDGFMHLTEGWLVYLVALGVLGAVAWVIARVEARRAGVPA